MDSKENDEGHLCIYYLYKYLIRTGMTPHLCLKGPVLCQTLYQDTLLSYVSVQLLSLAMSKQD